MDFVFDHGAQPFPNRNGGPVRSSALPLEMGIAKRRQELYRFPMQTLGKLHHLLISVRQFTSAAGVAAQPSRDGFGKHVALNGSNVANLIAEREFPFAVRPFQLFGRDTLHYPHGSLADFRKVVEKAIDVMDFHVVMISEVSWQATRSPVLDWPGLWKAS